MVARELSNLSGYLISILLSVFLGVLQRAYYNVGSRQPSVRYSDTVYCKFFLLGIYFFPNLLKTIVSS